MTHPDLVRAIHPSAIHLNVCLAHSTDSDKANARLIGIEYIISRRLFEGLPADEKRFWHSHEHEVRNSLPGSMESLAACQILEAGDRLLLKCSRRHLAHVRKQQMFLQVMSGQLVAPRVPEAAERLEMSTLVDT